jgi:3-dehydroquinate synthase
MTHIFLYGPPGTGKSTIGKILAENLALPFIDLDRVIESHAGMSIPKIMEEQGETEFRDLETTALKNILNEPASIVALGGGALLRDENRAIAESNGKIILLMAELATLFERMNDDANQRPLLAGDLREKLTALMAQRKEHYNSFALQAHVDGKTSAQNALQAQTLFGRFHLRAMGDYDAVVQAGALDDLGAILKSKKISGSVAVVSDSNVAPIYAQRVLLSLQGAGYAANLITVPAGEENKNLETISFLWKSFLENKLDRKSAVVALGGGVVGDMTGFAAATYMRGVAWVGVPTSLLSMVDSSLGGKTGFDLPEGKNLIGSFYPPKLVLADPQVLSTLPKAEFISGLAEVVKHGIISDPELFSLCARGLDWVKDNLEEIVKRAMAVKIKVIEDDPYEQGFRAALNLGHTVGHAVELVSKFQLRHGEAIAIGMAVEAQYSQRIGPASSGTVEAIIKSLTSLGLPTQIPEALPRAEILRAMRVDKKKNAKTIRFALPVKIGKVELTDVTDLDAVL